MQNFPRVGWEGRIADTDFKILVLKKKHLISFVFFKRVSLHCKMHFIPNFQFVIKASKMFAYLFAIPFVSVALSIFPVGNLPNKQTF